MARKALLIGSQTGELSGVYYDIESMAAALDPWGFAITRCEAADATRDGILEAYERLIGAAAPDDSIVVYYSGHGGYCKPLDHETDAQPRMAMQFIVPTDYDQSSPGNFRGIMSVELSRLQARLTEKTKNVTVALDCCHAAHMARDDGRGLRAKALARTATYDDVVNHFEGVLRLGDLDGRLSASNPWVVRVVACAPEQSAYEYLNADGNRTGILTEALTRALTQAHRDGLKISWAAMVDRVREKVLTLNPAQRPDVEGPAQRLLFQTAETDTVATLPALVSGDRVSLRGAALFGVRVGDEFTIMPQESMMVDDDTKIGDVVIDDLEATAAAGVMRRRSERRSAPEMGAQAFQVKASAPAMAVRLPQGEPGLAMLAQEVELSPILRAAEPGEESPVEVRVDDEGGLTVWDQYGPMHAPHLAGESGIAQIMRSLKRLSWAKRLSCLDADPSHELGYPIDVEFGTVKDGEVQPLSTSGGVLYLGQRIYLRVRNEGKQRVYVSLVNIAASSQVTVLNQASPGGEGVDPGADYIFGWNGFKRALLGSTLSWPAGLPRTQPRPETVIVLVTSKPQAIYGLEQPGARGKDMARSSLERLFDQIDDGGPRDITPDTDDPVYFTVKTVNFELVPTPPPVSEEPEFQVDERPEPTQRLWSPKNVSPQNIAVRLTNLVVHRNRALRSADIRLDAVVLTRGPGQVPIYTAWTERCHNISDGQSLPLEKVLVYHGPAVDYLDLAVWVSRDASGSLDLADLMQEKLTGSEVQSAMGHIGGLLIAAPQAAVAVAAIGAGAVVINAAYHLLNGIVGNSIGLFRTTFLAGERFGAGRPLEQCTIRAQDFSLTYLVEDVG